MENNEFNDESDFLSSYMLFIKNGQNMLSALSQKATNYVTNKAIGSKLEDFDIIKKIGRGATGSVYKVISKLNFQTYALKKIETKHLNKENIIKLWKEVAILKGLNHTNIISFFTSFLDTNCLNIVAEYARYGDLDKVIFIFSGSRSKKKKESKYPKKRFGGCCGKLQLGYCTFTRTP